MPRNGSGTYSLPTGNPVVTGSTISSTTHNSTMSDIATAITASISKDGQTVPSANLPMGGYKHTNVASATARTEYCTAGQAQDNTFDWLSSVSGANTITATAPVSMSAYAAGQCFRFTSSGANTGATTININAVGAKSITKNGGSALAANDIPSGAVVEIVYDGTNFELVNAFRLIDSSPADDDIIQRKSGAWTNQTLAQFSAGIQFPSVQGVHKNLSISTTGTNATVTASADEVALENSSNSYVVARSVSLSINTASSGANGLDTGTIAGSTWYSVWVIAKSDGTTAGLVSASATSPTMPSGYTYKARVGWIRTDGTANKYPLSFSQSGRVVEYKIASGSNLTGFPLMTSGASGNIATPTYTAVSVSSFVPSTAARIHCALALHANAAIAFVAPNNAYGGGSSTTAPAPLFATTPGTSTDDVRQAWLMLESTNVYWANNSASSYLFAIGWEDNL